MESPIYEQRIYVQMKEAINLDDRDIIEEFIVDICAVIGVQIILGPISVKHVDEDSKKSGISAMAIFAESSVIIHTWPHYTYATMDLFSCAPFEVGDLVEIINFYFMPMKLEVN